MNINGSIGAIGTILALLLALTVIYTVGRIFYNLYLHPLARFPGPLWCRATRLGYVLRVVRGSLSLDLLEFHKKYGPVVRIAPNELAFAGAQAWKDIYGHRTGNNYRGEELPKSLTFYMQHGKPHSILDENRTNHQIIRRSMSHGFSDRSMREQESIIGGYVDLLVCQLHKRCTDSSRKDPVTGLEAKQKMDMVSWYNWTTFDIIGDLAFGEPFGSLAKGEWDPWVANVNGLVRILAFVQALRFLGLEFVVILLFKLMANDQDEHMTRLRHRLQRRMAMTEERPDLIGGLLKAKDEWLIDVGRIEMNAQVLLLGGSETMATLLSGVTYLLLRNPDAMTKVTKEVRSSFKSAGDITLTSVNSLSYMLACLNEALRVYPPVATGLPRVAPDGGAKIAGEAVPEGTVVAVWHWANYHADEYWADPFSFHPERFLDDPRFANDKRDVLQPFSTGPRNCLGRNLAYAEMRLILARLLFDFDMELVDVNNNWLDHKVYIMWEKPPLNVYLTPVKR